MVARSEVEQVRRFGDSDFKAYHAYMNPSSRRTGAQEFDILVGSLQDGSLWRACEEIAGKFQGKTSYAAASGQPLAGADPRAQPLAGADPETAVLEKRHGINALIADWIGWRKTYATRSLQPLAHTGRNRPDDKMSQRAWHTYVSFNTNGLVNKQWLKAPMLVDWLPNLVDNKPPDELWSGVSPASGGRAMHYTSIARIMALAMKHPLVDEVEKHKEHKAKDLVIKDSIGRAVKGHQSKHDLKFTLAASGANMYVGVTVNATHPKLLSIWWQAGRNLDELQRSLCEAVFFDVVEAEHMVPEAVADRFAFYGVPPSQPLARPQRPSQFLQQQQQQK